MNKVKDIERHYVCPKCQLKFLRKSVSKNPRIGEEWFCDSCHEYFGTWELITHWKFNDNPRWMKEVLPMPIRASSGYKPVFSDAGLLIAFWEPATSKPDYTTKIIATTWYEDGYVTVMDEPFWKTKEERDLNYAVLNEDWKHEALHAWQMDWARTYRDLEGGL